MAPTIKFEKGSASGEVDDNDIEDSPLMIRWC